VVSRSLTADQGQELRVGELLKRTEQRIQSRRGIPRPSENDAVIDGNVGFYSTIKQ
jgi:hypothetical protein